MVRESAEETRRQLGALLSEKMEGIMVAVTAIKADVLVLKDANPGVVSVRQLEVATRAMADRMERMEATVNGIAFEVHGPVHDAVLKFPIRLEQELDEAIQRRTRGLTQ